VVRNKKTGKWFYFKNLDQPNPMTFPEPFITSSGRYRYLKCPSEYDPQSPGVWAGVNEKGVVVLGADGNSLLNYCGIQVANLEESLKIYELVLAECGDVSEAISFLISAYQRRRIGGTGDIIIIGDRYNAVALEYSLDRWGLQFIGDNACLVRSNFFVLLDKYRPRPEENGLHVSAALRYSQALTELSVIGDDVSLNDVFNLVRSHVNGPSAMSICRHGGAGEYYTQCSFVVELASEGISSYVILNEFPCRGEFKTFYFRE
jgi:hypothetical protein